MREVALLALMRGVSNTSRVLGLEEKQVQEWIRQIGNDDPFFDALRGLLYESIKQSGIEGTSKTFKVAVPTLEKLQLYFENNSGCPPLITPDYAKAYPVDNKNAHETASNYYSTPYRPRSEDLKAKKNEDDMDIEKETITTLPPAIKPVKVIEIKSAVMKQPNNEIKRPERNAFLISEDDLLEEWFAEDDVGIFEDMEEEIQDIEEENDSSSEEEEMMNTQGFLSTIKTDFKAEKDSIDAATKLMLVGEALKEGGGKFAATANRYGVNRKQLRRWVLTFQTNGNVFPTLLKGKAASETLQAVAKDFTDSEGEISVL
ncbi:unnamed protein product [Blepharisma stoltei]|uniref:Helix-turn-helix domain-containing protein n=1 Tax=Blepharisma stoltei TaxID=1481888 RepID=A0AAU9J0R1_9CILI|nr:unnamed protein product [Blepharisma stoltei]